MVNWWWTERERETETETETHTGRERKKERGGVNSFMALSSISINYKKFANI